LISFEIVAILFVSACLTIGVIKPPAIATATQYQHVDDAAAKFRKRHIGIRHLMERQSQRPDHENRSPTGGRLARRRAPKAPPR